MGSVFVHSTLMAIRRQLDSSSDAISIRRLLNELRAHPDLIDRGTFVALYPPELKDLGERDFDRLVGAGRKHPDPAQIAADLAVLDQKGASIGKYATAVIAHYLDKPTPPAGTFQDLEECIKCIWELTDKYRILLKGIATPSPVPTFTYDWKAVFSIPWISGGAEVM